MVLRWVIFAYLMILSVVDCHEAPDRARSTFLSFDIKKKVKHHKHGINNSRIKTPHPHKNTEEEIEFTLRVRDLSFVDFGFTELEYQ